MRYCQQPPLSCCGCRRDQSVMSHLFHHQHILVCRTLNAHPSPGGPSTQNQPILSIHNWMRRPCWLNVRNGYVLSPQTITNRISAFPLNHPLYPRVIMRAWCFLVTPDKAPTLSHTIRRLDMCVILSTTDSFFLLVSPRSEDGYFPRDNKGGSGWPVDRRGHARIGSQVYQSAEDK